MAAKSGCQAISRGCAEDESRCSRLERRVIGSLSAAPQQCWGECSRLQVWFGVGNRLVQFQIPQMWKLWLTSNPYVIERSNHSNVLLHAFDILHYFIKFFRRVQTMNLAVPEMLGHGSLLAFEVAE
jgi:hypothetical protein